MEIYKTYSEMEKAIEDFDSLNIFEKSFTLIKAKQMINIINIENKIKKATGNKFVNVVFVGHDFAIVENSGSDLTEGYPYVAVIKSEDEWESTNYLHPSIDRAILHAIGVKHEGINSQFAGYAWKMLVL